MSKSRNINNELIDLRQEVMVGGGPQKLDNVISSKSAIKERS